MDLEQARLVASDAMDRLSPHCARIEIAGSIRRCKPENIKDVELVLIPKDFDVGLFESGIALVIEKWGNMLTTPLSKQTKYTKRRHESGAQLDIFFVDAINWGYRLAVLTGSDRFSKSLAKRWVALGYKGIGGNLTKRGEIIAVREEIELFKILGLQYAEPARRF